MKWKVLLANSSLGIRPCRRLTRAAGQCFALAMLSLLPATALAQTVAAAPAPVPAQLPFPEGEEKEHAAPVDAELEKRLRGWVRQGMAAYQRGKWAEARLAFERAWSLQRHATIAASLAELEMKSGKYEAAAQYWDYYLDHLPPDRAEAEARLAECRTHLARVRVRVDRAGADVFVDGKKVGESPLDSDLWLGAGSHTFLARLAARASGESTQQLGKGENEDVVLTLGEAPPSAVPRPVTLAPQPRAAAETKERGNQRLAGVVAGSGLTLVAGIVGVVYGVRANQLRTRYEDLAQSARNEAAPELSSSDRFCTPTGDARPATCSSLRPAIASQRRAATFANVAYGLTGLFAVATLVTLGWPETDEQTSAKRRLTFTGLDAPGATGLSADLRF